ncbi:hypothetical protein MASR1M90_19840 [Desulfovibrionales bacterium]
MHHRLQTDIALFLKSMMAVLASHSLSLAEKLDHGGQLIQAQVHSAQASVMLVDEQVGQLKVVAASRKEIVGMVQKLTPDSVSGYVCTTKKPLLIKDITQDARFACRSANYRTMSLVSVPLLSQENEVIGVINVSDKVEEDVFSENDLAVLLEYAQWITPLIENLCFQDKLEQEKERYQSIARELEIKQQELLIASQERSELVQMVVHDFKSPLSAIISNLDLLAYMGSSDAQKPIIETAFKGAENLLEMIDEFLHLARLDEWQQHGDIAQAVDFLPVLDAKLAELQPSITSKNLTVENVCTEPVRVLGDPVLLGHLVQNLLSNAVKYTPADGAVRIGMKHWLSRRIGDPSQHVLKLYVEDTGPGIEDHFKERIFEKFVRTDAAVHSRIKGTGIGLFICRKIVTILKGKIWVEDVQPHGSRFCVILFAATDEGMPCPLIHN